METNTSTDRCYFVRVSSFFFHFFSFVSFYFQFLFCRRAATKQQQRKERRQSTLFCHLHKMKAAESLKVQSTFYSFANDANRSKPCDSEIDGKTFHGVLVSVEEIHRRIFFLFSLKMKLKSKISFWSRVINLSFCMTKLLSLSLRLPQLLLLLVFSVFFRLRVQIYLC